MAPLARSGARLPPLATLGGEGVLGRQGRQRPRNEAERALQAADLRALPGRLRGDLAHSVLWRWPPAVGVGLSPPRQRLAPLPRSDRAADAAPVAGGAPQVDSRQCGRALRAGRSISGSVNRMARENDVVRSGRGLRRPGVRTIWPRRGSSFVTPVIPGVSTPVSTSAMPPPATWVKPSSIR